MQPIQLPIINGTGGDPPLAVDPQNVKLAIEIRTQEEHISGEKAEKTGWRRYAGIFLAITSSFFYSLTIVIAKMMEDYHPLNLTVWRFMGILVPAVPITLYYKYVKKVATQVRTFLLSKDFSFIVIISVGAYFLFPLFEMNYA